VEFSVNGRLVKQNVGHKTSLLRVLRDDLNLIGTKEGCTTGDCGTCIVLVDGKPVDSCLHLARRTDGCQVETIEALAEPGGRLHPLQAAFLESGAVQCGFCIPGMIMASKALLATNPSPKEPEIQEALKDVICRCTGYTQIIEAVQLAARWLASPAEYAKWTPKFGPMGTSMVLADGEQSVRGQLIFADDMVRERMLHGQIVWSQHPHARIVRLDKTRAEQAPGVAKVVTAADVPGLNAHGRTRPDLPVFCTDRVRFTGDILALVVAESKEQAVEAAKLVEVEYEPLPGVYSI
jgi:aerobic-type carbon monoxide dehydrogenase small subunit (CoxS/CutS family)